MTLLELRINLCLRDHGHRSAVQSHPRPRYTKVLFFLHISLQQLPSADFQIPMHPLEARGDEKWGWPRGRKDLQVILVHPVAFREISIRKCLPCLAMFCLAKTLLGRFNDLWGIEPSDYKTHRSNATEGTELTVLPLVLPRRFVISVPEICSF